MKKINSTIIFISLFVFAYFAQSCTKDFKELNTDPKNPTSTTMPVLFNGIIKSLQNSYGELSAIFAGQYYRNSQQLANATENYSITYGADQVWENYYYSLKNIRLLYEMIEESPLNMDNAKACLDILFAYKTLRMADYVGDMPFFEAGKGSQGPEYFFAAYDKHQDIYKHCMDLLLNASKTINLDADRYSFGNGDTFFKGSTILWKKFANSVLLRYAIQAADVDNTYLSVISELLGDADKYPMISGTETVGLWPKQLGNMIVDSHPWSYRENNNTCMGTTMWNLMSETDATDGSGIFDPRCFVFFEPNNDGEWKARPQNPDANTPVQERGPYRTDALPNGRNKGATLQEWENKGVGCRFSPVNFYLATNDNFIPEIMITVAEVHFLRAEAYNRGLGVTKDPVEAKSEYEAGITASLNFWYQQIVKDCDMWIWHKPTLTQEQVDNYLLKMTYSGDETTALKQIYAQLWIDSFRQPWVGFNLYRRTLATPHDVSGAYSSSDYNFYKVPYPETEKLYNATNFKAATGGDNSTTKKLFWHK